MLNNCLQMHGKPKWQTCAMYIASSRLEVMHAITAECIMFLNTSSVGGAKYQVVPWGNKMSKNC